MSPPCLRKRQASPEAPSTISWAWAAERSVCQLGVLSARQRAPDSGRHREGDRTSQAQDYRAKGNQLLQVELAKDVSEVMD